MKIPASQYLYRSIALCALLFCVYIVHAQQFDWAAGLGGTANDESRQIAIDANGNVYVSGFFQGIADFDPDSGVAALTSQGSIDIFIGKYSSSGDLIWAKSIGGTSGDLGFGLCLDSAANIYITGYFQGTVDFDPGLATFNLTTAGNSDVFVCKLDSAGGFVWARQIGGTDLDFASSITCDKAGNTFVSGYFKGTIDADPGTGVFNLTSSGNNDIFICKLSPMGNFEWAKAVGGMDDDRPTDVALDELGQVYLTGHFQNTASFDPSVQFTSNGADDIFISKFAGNGQFQWAKALGGTGNDRANTIEVDASNNVYTAGSFTGSVDFDPNAGSTQLNSAGAIDIYVQKLDSTGNFIWAKRLGGPGFESVLNLTLDESGHVYTTGYFYDSVDFDPGNNNCQLFSSGNSDVFISKLDSIGEFISAINFGGNSFEFGQSLALDQYNHIYASGSFIDTIDFDPATANSSIYSNGSNDVFIAKYLQCDDTMTLDLGLDTVLCANFNQSILLDAGSGFDTYFWPDGSTASSLLIDEIFNQQNGDTVWLGAFKNGCSAFDTIVVGFDICGAISQATNTLDIKVYPNPTSNKLTIEFEEVKKGFVSVIDAYGSVIMKEELNNKQAYLSLKELTSGFYFIRIQVDGIIFHQTIIRQ